MQHKRRIGFLGCFLFCTLLGPSFRVMAQNFTFTLNPENEAVWSKWRSAFETNVQFVAKLTGDTDNLTSTAYTFSLSDVSDWPGYCMNKNHPRTL